MSRVKNTLIALSLCTLASCGCPELDPLTVQSGTYSAMRMEAPESVNISPDHPVSLTMDAAEGTALLRYTDRDGIEQELMLEVESAGTYPP